MGTWAGRGMLRTKSRRRVIGSSFQGVKVRVEDARPDTSFLGALPATRLRGGGAVEAC